MGSTGEFEGVLVQGVFPEWGWGLKQWAGSVWGGSGWSR